MTHHDDMYELIQSIASTDAVSADEGALRALLTERLEGWVDRVEVDALGNLIVSKSAAADANSTDTKTLFAFLDEPGLVVTHIDSDGRLCVAAVGEVSAQEALGARVRFEGGVWGVVVAQDGSGGSSDFTGLRIDIGASSKDEAERRVLVGARAAYDGPLVRQGDVVMGKSIARKVGCAVVVEALKRSTASGLRVVFAAQELLGGRGLAAIASGSHQIGEAVGVSLVDASPRATGSTAVKLGAGPALVVQDGAHIADPGLAARLEAAASEQGVHVQRYVSRDGARGPGFLQRSPGGVCLAMVGIPARNISGIAQIVHLGDASAAADVLVRWAEGD